MSTPIDNEKYAPSGKRVQLPSIPSVSDGTLLSAVSKLKETIDVREGRVGSKYEQIVTWRDLFEMGLVATSSGGSWSMASPNGAVRGTTLLTSIPSIRDQLEIEIRNSRAYKTLMARINSPEALADLPDEVRAIFEADLVEEAKKRQAAIQELQLIIQNENKSFAMKVGELTASVQGAHAGVRQVSYASAEKNKATAGLITQVTARLDDFGGPGVTVEEKMTATVNRLDGMSGVYSVKITAGGKFAGYQLSVDAPVGTTPYSAFLIDADKFAIFTSAGDFSPFGTDASGVYMNGTVRINVGGMTLSQLATNAAVPSTTFIGSYSTVPSGNKNEIYKNTTDGITYIHTGTAWTVFVTNGTNGANGTDGTNGSNGTPGARGSQIFYATGTPWAISDSEAATGGANDTANSAVSAITGSSTRIIGDTVTIKNSGGTAVATRYWGGSSWLKPGVTIDGNLLVNGSVSTNSLSASLSILTDGAIKARGQNSNFASIWADNPNSGGRGVIANAVGTGSVGIITVGASVGLDASSAGTGVNVSGDTKGIAVNSYGGIGLDVFSVTGTSISSSGKTTFTCSTNSEITMRVTSSGSGSGAAIFTNSYSSKEFWAGAGSYCAYSPSGKGKIYILDGNGPFTGFHDALIESGIDVVIGDIVVDTSVVYKHDINNTLTEVEPCSAAYQKTIAGVISEVKAPDNYLEIPYELWWEIAGNKNQLAINALGEGQVNVCGYNGNIEAGDLITTSPISGKGMRADDNTSVNQIVGKARESVTFNSPEEVKMIACFYMCG